MTDLQFKAVGCRVLFGEDVEAKEKGVNDNPGTITDGYFGGEYFRRLMLPKKIEQLPMETLGEGEFMHCSLYESGVSAPPSDQRQSRAVARLD